MKIKTGIAAFVVTVAFAAAMAPPGFAAGKLHPNMAIEWNQTMLNTFATANVAPAAANRLAGVIAAPQFAITPGMDANVLILALVVVVLGGLGSIEGALLGAVLLGLSWSVGITYFQQFAIALIFAVMAVVLIVRPRGIFGRQP